MITIPFHVDGCPGCAEVGDHELRQPTEAWCAECDATAVFEFRFLDGGLRAFCVVHGAEQIYAHAAGQVWHAPDGHNAGRGAMEDAIFCRLRGRNVPISECVSSCPAPEQRAVCAYEFDPISPQLAQYQAESR